MISDISPAVDITKNQLINSKEKIMKILVKIANAISYGLPHSTANRWRTSVNTFLGFSTNIFHRATNFAKSLIKTFKAQLLLHAKFKLMYVFAKISFAWVTSSCSIEYIDHFHRVLLSADNSACLYFRSSPRRCSLKKGVLRNFAKFTGNTCARASFFNKVINLYSILWKLW